MKRKIISSRIIPVRLIVWIILMTLIIASLGLFFGGWWQVNEVECVVSDGAECPQEVRAQLNRYEGVSVFNLRTNPIRNTLIRAIPTIAQVNFAFEFPDTFRVILVPAEPLALLRLVGSESSYLVSKEYRLIDTAYDGPSLVLIDTHVSSEDLSHGGYIEHPALRFSLDVVGELISAGVAPSRVEVYGSHEIQVFFHNGKIGIMSRHLPLSRQVTSLQVFLATATMGQDYQVIDLRHNRPVLRRVTGR